MDGVQRFDRAADLPEAWDGMARSLFQTRSFLGQTEATNPCRQRYYVFRPADRITAGAIVYTLRLDLLTYARIPSPLRMQFVGVPCSVGWPGVLGETADLPYLLRGIRELERGLLVGLNTIGSVGVDGIPEGQTLPCVVLDRGFDTVEDYRRALRADYRRRFDRIRSAFRGLDQARSSCTVFDASHHRLYQEAFTRSDAKLERLPLAFFQGLPDPFRLTVFRRGGTLVGWHVSLFEREWATFFMGGVEQSLLETHKTYHNLLFSVLEQAWEEKCTTVDLGQTAEVAKTRVGGRLEPRGMFAWPQNPLLRRGMVLGRRFLEYRSETPEVHVFR